MLPPERDGFRAGLPTQDLGELEERDGVRFSGALAGRMELVLEVLLTYLQ